MSGSREKFFFHLKGFSGTDRPIYHSDVKMRSCSLKIVFYSLKVIFQNCLRPNSWEIKKFFLNLLKNVKNSVGQNNLKCSKLD